MLWQGQVTQILCENWETKIKIATHDPISMWVKQAKAKFTLTNWRLPLTWLRLASSSFVTCKPSVGTRSTDWNQAWWSNLNGAWRSKRCQVCAWDRPSASSWSIASSSARCPRRKKRRIRSTLIAWIRKYCMLCAKVSARIWAEKANRSTWLSRAKMRSQTAGTWTKYAEVWRQRRYTASHSVLTALSSSPCGRARERALRWPCSSSTATI